VVGEFNRAQTACGRLTCGNSAAADWLKKHRPKVAIHPSMTDYCDTCKHLKEQQSRNQAILNHSRQSGSSSASEIRSLEENKADLESKLKEHKKDATKSREHYNTTIAETGKYWSEILRLTALHSPSQSERDDLKTLKHTFTLTISADYQQSKLIPNWGRTEQPRSTYYLQKVSLVLWTIPRVHQ
jgi:chromosome segregation ATPase